MFDWFKTKQAKSRVDPVIGLDSPRLTLEVREKLRGRVMRVPGLSDEDSARLFQAGLKAVAKGGDMRTFALEAGPCDKLSSWQFTTLGNDMCRIASSIETKANLLRAGITTATWQYTSGGCCGGDPEVDALHRSLSGRQFSLKDGMKVGKRHIFPAQEDECRCRAVPVILDDD